ncbi:unnamed protein product [Spirodela intermedia]|uniref:Uncharacterized protein n=1 Tax=Spirodela intermedia TaxID=51605 RepID=A0A7I8IEG3_SPIIN|nr:unnamed protein product [Spirodela intermedia]CAA6655765.1 unnamed protein product [Spirodela intermedia]
MRAFPPPSPRAPTPAHRPLCGGEPADLESHAWRGSSS